MASFISVRLSRVADVDQDAFIALATELLEELDEAQVLLPRMVPKRLLPEGVDPLDDWTWQDIITHWAKLRLEKGIQ